MTDIQKAAVFDGDLCEVDLSEADRETFGLDTTTVLVELRPYSGLYGVFYKSKGMQWDIWSDTSEVEEPRNIAYAMTDPVRAASALLRHGWRPDIEYEPEEE
jgi:hypothetical protein